MYSKFFIYVFLVFLCQPLLAKTPLDAAANKIEVTDLAGRTLSFNQSPQRIILGESRYLAALSILDREDPLRRIVGMLADLQQIDYGGYQQYREKFPHIEQIPHVGHTSADSFSLEKVLSLNADLAIFGLDGHGPNSRHAELIDQLERAGVQVVFIDFRNKPIENTIESIALLGKIFDRQQRANQFLDFYRQQLARVETGLSAIATQGASPKVFIHSRAGLHDECCETMVKGMMAGFLHFVRGQNIAADHVPGYAGTFNLEYLLVDQPDIYIATAVGGSEEKNAKDADSLPYVHMGAGVDGQRARASFRHMLHKNKLDHLRAVKSGKAYAIWHHFYNSPLNIIAIQVFAKWLYPQAFVDLDPQRTLQTLFDRFQSVPLRGTYWITL